jgi:hypothetical protein
VLLHTLVCTPRRSNYCQRRCNRGTTAHKSPTTLHSALVYSISAMETLAHIPALHCIVLAPQVPCPSSLPAPPTHDADSAPDATPQMRDPRTNWLQTLLYIGTLCGSVNNIWAVIQLLRHVRSARYVNRAFSKRRKSAQRSIMQRPDIYTYMYL